MPRVSSAVAEVWRERALAAEARERDLLEKYHALKAKGAFVPTPARVVPPAPDPEAEALRRREEEIVGQLADEIGSRKGVPPQAAREEAERIRREALQTFVDR